METIKRFAYPIVVIESVWPHVPIESPKITGNEGARSIIKPYGNVGEYGGYYKVIPLNISSITTSSKLEGHSFTITFDPSYVYVEFDARYFPPELAADIRNEALDIDSFNLHTLIGVLKNVPFQKAYGANTESFIVPFDTVATIVDELDTVSVYLVSDEDVFDFESILRIGGGSFSRITPGQANSQVEVVRAFGLPETRPNLETLDKKVGLFRNYLSAIGILSLFNLRGRFMYPIDFTQANYIEEARKWNVEGLRKFKSGDISFEEFLSYYPRPVAEKIRTGFLNIDSLISEANSYYSSGTKTSKILPYNYYKTIEVTLFDIFGTTSGIDAIALTAGIDAALAKYNPYLFSEIRNDYLDTVNVRNALDFLSGVAGISLTENDYLSGLNRWSNLLDEFYGKLYANNTNTSFLIGSEEITIEETTSSETPYLLLKGHVTSVSTSTSISVGGGTKTVTISGAGLEVPLQRHTVFFDVASANRLLLQLSTQFSVINSTPIEAAKHILDTFMPEQVELVELDENDFTEAAQYMRDYAVFIQNSGKKVSKGALIVPDLLDEAKDSYVFAPIRYVSTDYLNFIKPAFDEVAIYERKAQVLDTAPEATVANVLDTFLGKNSIYTWFVDKYGNLITRFELGQAVVPTDPVLSPYIFDKHIISINTTIDESRVYTNVEVVPKGFSYVTPSEGNFAGIFGRSVPPSVADAEALYTKLELPTSTEKLRDIAIWIKNVLADFNNAVLKALKIVQSDGQLKYITGISSIFNNSDPDTVLNTLNEKTSGELNSSTIYSPAILSGIYKIDSGAVAALISLYNENSVRPFKNSQKGYLAFSLQPILLSNIASYKEISQTLERSILNNAPSWLSITQVRGNVIESWIYLLSTLAVLGVSNKNATQYITSNTFIQEILRNSPIYIDAKVLDNAIGTDVLLPKAPEQRSLPYEGVQIQDVSPENTSADLYKYGLRIHRVSDNYLATLNLTKFRAEFLRKIHEDAILKGSVRIVGSPRYDIGTTVLVTSKDSSETRDGYVHEGLRKTFIEIKDNTPMLELIYSDNTALIESGYTYKTPFSPNQGVKLTREEILNHLQSAIEFILSESGGRPVPLAAYVPFIGMYNTGEPLIDEYLSILVRLYMPETAKIDERNVLLKRLSALIGELAQLVYGEDNMTNRNKLMKYLEPQNYLASQFYISGISHQWSIESFYLTQLELDYGRPVMLVRTEDDIAGYLITKSPAMLYTINGSEEPVIKKDSPLYISLINQVEMNKVFFTDSIRYRVSKTIDKVKYLMRRGRK